jgi:hypothetical protein
MEGSDGWALRRLWQEEREHFRLGLNFSPNVKGDRMAWSQLEYTGG